MRTNFQGSENEITINLNHFPQLCKFFFAFVTHIIYIVDMEKQKFNGPVPMSGSRDDPSIHSTIRLPKSIWARIGLISKKKLLELLDLVLPDLPE